MNILLALQLTGGLLNLLAKNSLKNKKVVGWYFQGIGTLAYFFVFIIIKDSLYQVFGGGLVLLSVYGAYKFHKNVTKNTSLDDVIRWATLIFMLVLLVLKIEDSPQDYLAITQMIAATCLMLGLRYLTTTNSKGWILIIIASILLVFIYFATQLWIMMIFQIISTYISVIGYNRYTKTLSTM
jgi:hypothetical protein